jgi:hypothetical protein
MTPKINVTAYRLDAIGANSQRAHKRHSAGAVLDFRDPSFEESFGQTLKEPLNKSLSTRLRINL